MGNFYITKTNGYRLTQEQYCFLDLTFSKLVASDEDMAATLDNVDIHLEDEKSEFFKIKDIDYVDCDNPLVHCQSADQNEAIYELKLLGSYCYDSYNSKGLITLYVKNIELLASSLTKHFNNALEYLTGYVIAHEAFHAYYDVDHGRTPVLEIEEPLAEFGALSFLRDADLPNIDLALYEAEQKKSLPGYLSCYGYGIYLYNNRQNCSYFIPYYRNLNEQIPVYSPEELRFAKSFMKGYPQQEEAYCFNLLRNIMSGKIFYNHCNQENKFNNDYCSHCGAALKPAGVFYLERNGHLQDYFGTADRSDSEAMNLNFENLDLHHIHPIKLKMYGVSIKKIDCSTNELETLDLSGVSGIEDLNCSGNWLTRLDLSHCQDLKYLNCGASYLMESDLSEIIINHSAPLESIDCSWSWISELTLGEDTKEVDCSYCMNLVNLNLTSSKFLEKLICYGTSVEILDVRALKKLKVLLCGDIEGYSTPHLKELYIGSSVEELDCSYCPNLSKIDFTDAVSLTQLYCAGTAVAILDLSAKVSLQEMICPGNAHMYKIATGPNVNELDCSDCPKLSEIDFTNAKSLGFLDCSGTSVEILDLSKTNSLSRVFCSGNSHLHRIVVGVNVKKLVCSNCPELSEIDFTNAKSLEYLDCSGTSVEILDLSEIDSLSDVICSGNSHLNKIAVGVNVRNLDCSDCPTLTEIDLIHSKFMDKFKCKGISKHVLLELKKFDENVIDDIRQTNPNIKITIIESGLIDNSFNNEC